MKTLDRVLGILVFALLTLYLSSLSTLGLCAQQPHSPKAHQKAAHHKKHVQPVHSTKPQKSANQKPQPRSVSKTTPKIAPKPDGTITITGHATLGVGPKDSITCGIVSGNDDYRLVMDSVAQRLLKDLNVNIKPGDMRELNSTKIRVTGKLTGQATKQYVLSLNSIAGGTVSESGESHELQVTSYKILQYPSASDRG